MTISQSLDEKFIERLREIIDEQQRHIDCITYDIANNNKIILKLISDIEDLSLENKDRLEELNKENYFLEKFNLHLELELTGKVPRFEVRHDKEK